MFYVNFEDHITACFGVVLENWPLKKFVALGSLSRIELEVLLNAWKNGMTRLTDDKWEKWMEAYRVGRATALVTPQYAPGTHIGAVPAHDGICTRFGGAHHTRVDAHTRSNARACPRVDALHAHVPRHA